GSLLGERRRDHGNHPRRCDDGRGLRIHPSAGPRVLLRLRDLRADPLHRRTEQGPPGSPEDRVRTSVLCAAVLWASGRAPARRCAPRPGDPPGAVPAPAHGTQGVRGMRRGQPRGREVLHVLRHVLLIDHAAFASFHAGNSVAIRTASSKLWMLISSTFTPSGTGLGEAALASRTFAQILRATSNEARPISRPRWARRASSVSGVIVAPSHTRNSTS